MLAHDTLTAPATRVLYRFATVIYNGSNETRGAMGLGKEHHAAALYMLQAFGSVGTTHFDVTWTDSAGKPVLFRRGRSLAELTRSMPPMLDKAITERRENGPG